MLNCKHASHLISQSLERRLNWNERFSLRMHLLICQYCRRFQQQIRLIKSALKTNVAQLENDLQHKLSPAAKERMARVFDSLL